MLEHGTAVEAETGYVVCAIAAHPQASRGAGCGQIRLCGTTPYSMQLELAIDEAKLLRRNEPTMSDTYPVERPIETGYPEIQETQEFWKFGGKVEVLPDIALQQHLMVRKAIDDLRCGQ